MWTAKIAEKTFDNGVLKVNVSYNDGTRNFNQIYPIQSEADLDAVITSNIERLENLDVLSTKISTGEYIPKPKEQPKQPTALEIAEKKLYDYKSLISLGVMKETDQEFIDAVTAYKVALGK